MKKLKRSKQPIFSCDNCGAQVSQSDTSCPVCGRKFASVLCPECGFTGEEKLFNSGCPKCGYEVFPGHRRNSGTDDSEFFIFRINPKTGEPQLSLWLWLVGVAALTLAGAMLFFFFNR